MQSLRSFGFLSLLAVTLVANRGQAQSYVVSTFAGASRLQDNGPATSAPLRSPHAVVADRAGNIYLADSVDNRIRRVSPNGTITTYAGTGMPGFSGDGGLATAAMLSNPVALAIDPSGNLLIADQGNSRIRRVTPAGTITTVAGNGQFSSTGDNGPATSAGMDPQALAFDGAGNLYVGDAANYRLRRITASGTITTIAGTGRDESTGDNGAAASAGLRYITGLAIDAQNNVYLSEQGSNRVRRINPGGTITTIAGNGLDYQFQGDNGPATSAQLEPAGLTVDTAGNVYVADRRNHRVRRINPSGTITTYVGTGVAGVAGDNLLAAGAQLNTPASVFADQAGNLYIADQGNGRIRRVDSGGRISTVAGAPLSGNVPAANLFLYAPGSLAVDTQGNIYVADSANNVVRRISASGASNIVAGTGQRGFSGDNDQAVNAQLANPQSVAVDASGNLYIADSDNYRIRRVSTGGIITTIAGSGQRGAAGDNGPATAAQLGYVTSIAVDNSSNLYLNDRFNYLVRRVSAAGIISTFAGNGQFRYSGDNTTAISTGLDPYDLAVDRQGILYIADRANNRIRRVDTNGNITTVAGTGTLGTSGDGDRAVNAQIAGPVGVAIDGSGNLYIAEGDSNLVRRVVNGVIFTIAGNGQPTYAGDNGPALSAQIDPLRLAADAAGNVYISDSSNDRVRKLTPVSVSQLRKDNTSGDNQAGTPGQSLAQPLRVQALSASGTPAAGVLVTFAVTQGDAAVQPASAATGPDGYASTTVLLGRTPGPVQITATVAGAPPVTFQATVNGPVVAPVPVISTGGVVSAASGVASAFAPNSAISIYGSNFASAGTQFVAGANDIVNGRLPTTLGGVCVLVDRQPAPLLAVYPNQINAIMPQVATGGLVDVTVVTNCGQANETRSAVASVITQLAAPELFTSGTGTSRLAAAVNAQTGVTVTDASPARSGDVITLYATGLGQTNPALAPGQVATEPAPVTGAIAMSIGGIPVGAADVLYAGAAPGFAGLYQINIRVPVGVGGGRQAVNLTVGGFPAPAGAYLPIGQ